MTRYQTATLRSGALHYKHLTVGDIRESATMKLYSRMFKRPSKKYIPVKDITNDRMGRELSAYLINPEYMDQSAIAPEIVEQQLEPKPVVRAIQYSRLSNMRRTPAIHKSLTERTATLFGIAMTLGKKAVHSIKQGAQKLANTVVHLPVGKTYSLRSGAGIHRRKKMLARTGAVVIVATFGVLGIGQIDRQPSQPQPNPITASSTSSPINGPITSTGITPDQPIPLFSKPDQVTPTASSTSSSYAYQGDITSQQQTQGGMGGGAVTEQPTSTSPTTTSPAPSTQVQGSVGGVAVGTEVITTPVPSAPPAAPVDTPNEGGLLTNTVDSVVDTTTQTLNGVTGLVDNLL